jgi:hypothetical protein
MPGASSLRGVDGIESKVSWARGIAEPNVIARGSLDRPLIACTSRAMKVNLVASSVVYLSIPLVVFLFGYLRSWIGLPLATLLLVHLARLHSGTPSAGSKPRLIPIRTLLFALFVALAWLAFSGIGGIGYQRWDFIKHNAVLKTLIDCAWPVRWSVPPYSFVYYFAWYLPAALVGKAFGWGAAQFALLLWSLLGVVLTLLWVQQLARRWFWTLPVMFLFMSGLDLIGYLLLHHNLPHADQLEWWSHPSGRSSAFYIVAQYSGSTSLLYYVPQQAIAGWLATALVLHTIYTRSYGEYLPTYFMALLLWSPLAAVGLIPFGLVAAWRLRVNDYFTAINIALVPATVTILALFYLSRAFPGEGGWPVLSDFSARGLPLLLFLALEVGVYFVCVAVWIREQTALDKWVAAVALLFLVLCPLYSYGAFNDWVMRSSIPALFVLWILLLRSLENKSIRVLAYCAWLIGATTALAEIARSLERFKHRPPDAASVSYVPAMGIEQKLREQYYGDGQSVFFRWIALP